MDVENQGEERPKRVLILVEWVPNGVRVSHCRPSAALADVAAEEMLDKTPTNMLQLVQRQVTDWINEYAYGAWSRGVHR